MYGREQRELFGRSWARTLMVDEVRQTGHLLFRNLMPGLYDIRGAAGEETSEKLTEIMEGDNKMVTLSFKRN